MLRKELKIKIFMISINLQKKDLNMKIKTFLNQSMMLKILYMMILHLLNIVQVLKMITHILIKIQYFCQVSF